MHAHTRMRIAVPWMSTANNALALARVSMASRILVCVQLGLA